IPLSNCGHGNWVFATIVLQGVRTNVRSASAQTFKTYQIGVIPGSFDSVGQTLAWHTISGWEGNGGLAQDSYDQIFFQIYAITNSALWGFPIVSPQCSGTNS